MGKLEFSGIRGSALSQQAQRMYSEFQEMYRVFSESSYDCLDPQSMVELGRANLQVCLFLRCLQPVGSGYLLDVPCAFSLALWSPWFYWQRLLLIILCVRRKIRRGPLPTADLSKLMIRRVSEMLRWGGDDAGGCGCPAGPKALSSER